MKRFIIKLLGGHTDSEAYADNQLSHQRCLQAGEAIADDNVEYVEEVKAK